MNTQRERDENVNTQREREGGPKWKGGRDREEERGGKGVLF